MGWEAYIGGNINATKEAQIYSKIEKSLEK